METEPTTGRIEAAGIGFEILEAGSGGRPLLLVHGFCGAKEDFGDHVVQLAARGWHVVAPDLRGHGSSDQPAAGYDLARLASDVSAVADALGWTTMVLLGHSMGGMVAQLFALENEARLDGLVLMDTGHGPVKGLDRRMVELGKEAVRSNGLGVLIELQALRDDPLATPAHQRLLEERPGYREFCDSKTMACCAEMWLSMVDEMIDQPDRLQSLASLSVPTLVVVGEQDAPFLADCRRMAETIPGAALEVVADAGHAPQLEAPERWWSAVCGFLDSLPRPAGAGGSSEATTALAGDQPV